MSELRGDLPLEDSVEEAHLLLAIQHFETGRLSLGQAAKMANHSKKAFMDVLAKADVPIFDYPASDLKDEIEV